MARVDVSTSSDLEPEAAWKLASDLSRFQDWMTIFGGWRGEVPTHVEKGTQVSSCIKVKGFRNVIHWTVTHYDEPHGVALAGRGRGGIRIGVKLTVSRKDSGSKFDLSAELKGGVLNGPVGRLVVRVVRSDIQKSVNNLAGLR